MLSRETQSQAAWVGPETVPSPGAAASAGAHYTLHSSCIRIARATCKAGTERTRERAEGGAQRRSRSTWFSGSRLRGWEGGGSAELGPHRQLQPRPLGAALAAHGVQPPAPTRLLPTRRLGARGRLSPGPASACVPAPARSFLLLLPAASSWVFVSGGRPSSLGRRSPALGLCGSLTGQELKPPARPRALQAVLARLGRGLPGRRVLGLGLLALRALRRLLLPVS